MTLRYKKQYVKVSEEQAAPWRVVSEGGRLLAEGPCPACGHDLEADITPEPVVALSAAARSTAGPSEQMTRTLHCSCTHQHPGRPPEVSRGCGRAWPLTVDLEDLGVRPGDLEMVAASRELVEVATGQVTAVRTAAEKWLGGVTAILGLLGVSGVAVGDDVLDGLADGPKAAVAVLLAAAVVAAVVAIINGYRAAFGWPVEVDVSDDEKLAAWFKAWSGRAADAAQHLKYSVAAAVLSLMLLSIAVGFMWFGTPAAPASPKVTIDYDQDGDEQLPASVCGSLGKSSDDTVYVSAQDGAGSKTVEIPSTWITGLSATDGCE